MDTPSRHNPRLNPETGRPWHTDTHRAQSLDEARDELMASLYSAHLSLETVIEVSAMLHLADCVRYAADALFEGVRPS